jgi:hypothetical protein
MSTSEPTNRKTNLPDSDQTARSKHADSSDKITQDTGLADLQTSTKSGKHSSVEKLAASRPEFSGRGEQSVPGAFGDDESHRVTGRNAAPDTNKFRCSACGRYFNTAGELSAHEPDCRTAKAATESGRRSLQQEDEMLHVRNDADK